MEGFNEQAVKKQAEKYEKEFQEKQKLDHLDKDVLMSEVKNMCEYLDKKPDASYNFCSKKFTKMEKKYPAIFKMIYDRKGIDQRMLETLITYRDQHFNQERESSAIAHDADRLLSDKFITNVINKK